MLMKIVAMGASSLIGVTLLAMQPPEPDGPPSAPPAPPPPPPKKKIDGGPAGDLRHAYELLRRLRAEGRSSGRPEERLRDWTERASRLYRDGVKAFESKDLRRAHEYGAAAHDLARAIEHSRNASVYEERDSELPPPPGAGPEGNAGRVRDELWHAHDRIRGAMDANEGPDAKFYLDAARDLYNAARRDAEAGRNERSGELARAAEAITHVSEHLAHATRQGEDGPRTPDRDDLPKGLYRREAIAKAKGFLPPRAPGDEDDAPQPKGRRGLAPPVPPPPPPPPLRDDLGDRPEPRREAGEPKRPPREPGDRPEPKKEQRRDSLPPDL